MVGLGSGRDYIGFIYTFKTNTVGRQNNWGKYTLKHHSMEEQLSMNTSGYPLSVLPPLLLMIHYCYLLVPPPPPPLLLFYFLLLLATTIIIIITFFVVVVVCVYIIIPSLPGRSEGKAAAEEKKLYSNSKRNFTGTLRLKTFNIH